MFSFIKLFCISSNSCALFKCPVSKQNDAYSKLSDFTENSFCIFVLTKIQLSFSEGTSAAKPNGFFCHLLFKSSVFENAIEEYTRVRKNNLIDFMVSKLSP